MKRVFNFSPGPAAVPEPVLRRAQAELLDWQGLGTSVMEVSHRGKPFLELAERSEAGLRDLLAIPGDYRVLFLQGGAQTQFSAVPLNLARPGARASYVDTGAWSAKAIGEARRYCDVHVAASSEADGFFRVPPRESWDIDESASYLHYTPNETISGVEFHWVPAVDGVPLVADMSSTILSRPVDVARFGLIYAGAQKNAGIAGLTLVIVHESLLGRADPRTPSPLNYALQAEQGSMANTPATFAWYVASLVFDWIRDEGGLTALAARNERKAAKLYAAIDASDLYRNPVHPPDRSWMNVTFVLADPGLDRAFLEHTEAADLVGLKGHRSVGGMRASIYNAMPEAGVDRLIDVMADFERRRA